MSKITLTAGVAFAVALISGLPLLGCKGSAKCADGATTNADTGICMKMVPDYKMEDKAMKVGDVADLSVRNSKNGQSFAIWIEKPDDLAKRSAAVAGMAYGDLKLVDSGDTTANPGKFYRFHNGPKNYDFAVALIPGKTHFYRCEVQNTPTTDAVQMMEMCKTLGGP